MLIVGVDGLVRAGKTTLIERLAKRRGWGAIPEYGIYLKLEHLQFPNFPPENWINAVSASQLFMQIEQLRIHSLRALSERHDVILVDRTFHSCLAFDYAARVWSGFDTFDVVTEQWRQRGHIVADMSIFLDVSLATLEERIAPHKASFLPHFYNERFNSCLHEYFAIQVRSATLLRIDADQTQQVVEKNVESLIDGWQV